MIKQKAPEHLRANTIQIISENNFNTAAGMASSASGLSCLAYALFKVYGIEASREEISMYARLGSGSACRSLEGGFVHWYRQIDYRGVPESIALRVKFDNE
jgi:diphosphomevalonate decarboxylase